MKQEVKDLWVEALSSGKYTKGKGALAYQGSYCCLGVLCEVMMEQGFPLITNKEPFKYTTYDGMDETLPKSVMEWSGMSSGNGRCAVGSLSDINDTTETTFSELASIIEAHWEKL